MSAAAQYEEPETSRYVTVFHQLKDTEHGERGDRVIAHGEHLDDRYKTDDEREGFVPVARPIAIIDVGTELPEDELSEWCESHAGKSVLHQFFPEIEPDDPTLPEVDEYLDDQNAEK